MEAETVDNFITDLYNLAEYCEYGALRDGMIRHRLVVGLRDLNLSEKLQLDADLTFEKAVNASRQSETVRKQQDVVRPKQNTANKHTSVDAVYKKHYRPKKPESNSKFIKVRLRVIGVATSPIVKNNVQRQMLNVISAQIVSIQLEKLR